VIGLRFRFEQRLAADLALGMELADARLLVIGRPDVIGPAGMNTDGRWPKLSAPIRGRARSCRRRRDRRRRSNIWCDSATAVDSAITSRENMESSMPRSPWVMPSHMAGTPPATCAVAPRHAPPHG
jgi:hypothetical protein